MYVLENYFWLSGKCSNAGVGLAQKLQEKKCHGIWQFLYSPHPDPTPTTAAATPREKGHSEVAAALEAAGATGALGVVGGARRRIQHFRERGRGDCAVS